MSQLKAKFCAGLAVLALAGAAQAATPTPPKRAVGAAVQAPPLFAATLAKSKAFVDPQLRKTIDVPVPADAGGGYTHERHKDNYRLIYEAGMLYRQTGDKAYAELVRRVLLDYAKLYPSLPLHPKRANQVPGRLFWQVLNDSVWLVNSIQGYEAVMDAIPAADRATIEAGVFRPMAAFLSTGSPKTFDSIHNHGTWALAAVGMTGYAIGDQGLVKQALYGLDGSGKSGFYKQLEELFSPDGYYAEGPYYQRYALSPFLLLAQSIQRHDPSRKILDYRDGVLRKAVYATIQQSYGGLLFPINDAIKDKGLDTPELVHGVAVTYAATHDPALLSIVIQQGSVVLSPEGREVAAAVARGEAKPFPFASMELRDGAKGDKGALVILRSGPKAKDQALVFKATSQGMGHGHFDKLSWQFYDAGREVVTDYGAARFLNVEAKAGGRYLPENDSWAQQTVAHNTLVVDEKSQFGANTDTGEKHWPTILAFDAKDGVQMTAASIDDAWPGVRYRRAMALIDRPEVGRPIVLDLVRGEGGGRHRFDLPLHYEGQIVDSGLKFQGGTSELKPLGKADGYQHLWDRGRAPVKDGARVSWFNQGRFYDYVFASGDVDQVVLTELGADDPDYNLRNERAFILRGDDKDSFTLAGVLEPHGAYSAAEEYARDTISSVKAVERVSENGADLVFIRLNSGKSLAIGVAWDSDPAKRHQVKTPGGVYAWTGFSGLASLAQ
ncbi:alginate lyase family protein [Caulobacter sp. RL271]|uniref:Heparinase II/III family protein n=1 Tax=Caulobacter segnis TaxID=88688 RepID=A0ABY4ZSS5_9CAUL|nr:alginate lyase family protein [Caulobacter segnis]USQ95873.1 heparinase II/III family protein [Caulobacter segnis]